MSKPTSTRKQSQINAENNRESRTPGFTVRATPDFIERLNYAAKIKNQTRVALVLSILSDWLDANYL